jgi:predicted RNA-binding Zn-ribbon protein involved in translation (DUF1610 family)
MEVHMADFVSLTCPNCGGKLEITPDLERFACAYCGAEHIVRRGGGIVSLQPVTEAIGKVQAGVDRTASELAIKRLKEEIVTLEQSKFELASAWDGLINITSWICAALTLFGLLLFWITDYDISILCITIILGLITALLSLYYNNLHKKYIKRITPIQEQINRRLVEIRHHNQIVSTQTIDQKT